MTDCVYLQEGRCLQGLPLKCDDCPCKLLASDPKFAEKWKDPLELISRERVPCRDAFRGMLAGHSAFLVCGGPSATEDVMEKLTRRGCYSLAVNNKAGHSKWRPQAFVCSDPPGKFSHSIWEDPAIMKFVPVPKLGGRRNSLRRKLTDGSFVPLKKNTDACPNVWAFKRWSWMFPDERFFMTDGACWGNHKAGAEKTGCHTTVCTMLLGMRLLKFLGASKIYLVGVDFKMSPTYGYSFNQDRDVGASASNNAQFAVINELLCTMAKGKVFERFGVSVYNTFRESGLRAFPFVPLDAAIAEAVGVVESVPNLHFWYEKKDKPS